MHHQLIEESQDPQLAVVFTSIDLKYLTVHMLNMAVQTKLHWEKHLEELAMGFSGLVCSPKTGTLVIFQGCLLPIETNELYVEWTSKRRSIPSRLRGLAPVTLQSSF